MVVAVDPRRRLHHRIARRARSTSQVDTESTTLGLDRIERGEFLAKAAAAGPIDHALACLLSLPGLRVSEACRIDIEHLGTERGHRTVTVLARVPSWL